MPTGLKPSSSTVAIGFSVTEAAPNTFTQSNVDLNLDPLNNEVFVVQSVDFQPDYPDALAGINTSVNAALTTTSRTVMPTLALFNCVAVSETQIRAAGFVDSGVGFQSNSLETPPAGLDYIAIIATNDFFIQVEGFGNINSKLIQGKLYGYRAKADASVYAALVQSEVLSA